MERIEECGDRIVDRGGGTIADVTLERIGDGAGTPENPFRRPGRPA